ncbi:MAG: FecCD family ABC transporter permease [Flavobacteriales bacterium]
MTSKSQHTRWYYGLIILCIFVVFLADLSLGSSSLNASRILSHLSDNQLFTDSETFIFYQIRLPRVLTACCAGLGLSVGGLLMQSFFRNPLAGPYVLGIGTGASLGVSLFIMGAGLGLGFQWQSIGILSSAFLGAVLVLMLISAISLRFRSNVALLIVGLMLSYFSSAIVQFLQYFSPAESVKKFAVWTMGSYTDVQVDQVPLFFLSVLIGLILAFVLSRFLDAFYLSNFEVEALGFSIKKQRFLVFFTIALLVASTTAFCGPIAFLGMAVPHFARLLFRSSNHKKLILQTALLGVLLSLIFDLLSQNPWSDSPIPLNAIASFLGAPLVVFLLWKRKEL